MMTKESSFNLFPLTWLMNSHPTIYWHINKDNDAMPL
jgi:hypothetical protein